MTFSLSFSSAELLALCFESVLYGAYIALLYISMNVLVSKRRRRMAGTTRLILVSKIFFVLITWHEIVDLIRLYLAFKTDDADLYFADVSSMLSVMKTALYLVETMVSDLFILYRCYVVWNASIAIVSIPTILYLADVGTSIAAIYTMSIFKHKGGDPVFGVEQERVSNSFFACTLSVNSLCTGLIAYRIWQTKRQTRNAKFRSNLSRVSIVVIESGAIYLSVLACSVASFVLKNNIFNIFLDITSPVIGIVFSLIIARIGLGTSSEDENLAIQSNSMLSNGNSTRATGPIVLRSTTTQFTDERCSDSSLEMDVGSVSPA